MRIYEAIRKPVLMYLDHHVSRASAALSYFLMLTIFPLLICLYYILGSLFPSIGELRELLGILLPGGTMETITEFLNYISLNTDKRMLSFAIAAMATSSAAAYRIVDKLMLELMDFICQNKLGVRKIEQAEPSLESLFLEVVNKLSSLFHF